MVISKATVVMENWNIPLTPRVKLGYSGENDVCLFEVITEPQEGFTYYLELQPLIDEANNILLTPDYVNGSVYVELTTEMLGSGGIKKAQIVAYIDTEDAPIKKSNIFEVEVDASINATKSVESHYQTALSQWAQILKEFNPQEVLAKLQEVEAEVNTAEEGITYITNLACRLYKFPGAPLPQSNPELYPGIRTGDLTFASGDLYFAQGVTESAITWKKLSGGGGGGTDDYNDLDNKPQINSVELSGNKTLANLGIQAALTAAQTSGIAINNDEISAKLKQDGYLLVTNDGIYVDISGLGWAGLLRENLSTDDGLTPYPLARKSYVDTEVAKKQDTLTVGNGITIDANKVISVGLAPTNTNLINMASGKLIVYGTEIANDSGLLATLPYVNEFRERLLQTYGNYNFQKQTAITTNTTDTTASLTLANDNEYRFTQELSSITLTLPQTPANNFISGLVFESGATPTAMTYDSSIKWSGDDVTSNAFVPVASKTYNIVFWFDGININAVARGV